MVKSALAFALLLLVSVAGAHDHGDPDGPGEIRVDSVIGGSAAEAAGVLSGDLIVGLAGRKVENMEQLRKILAEHRPGDRMQLTVDREGEEIDLTLTFAESSGGGVSMGVRLMASGAAAYSADGEKAEAQCLAWVEETYRIDSLMQQLGLELQDDYDTARACIGRDARRMPLETVIKYCDNVFKVHCSGVDLLAEIGEALVDRCEQRLDESLGLKPEQYKSWKTCGQHKVFDRYSMSGESSDGRECSAAFLECGESIDAAVEAGEISAEQRSFVGCCSADALDAGSGDACGMIDEGFSRGPCNDRPVCVNRLTSEWLHCSVLGKPHKPQASNR